jgi:hypothetical protein
MDTSGFEESDGGYGVSTEDLKDSFLLVADAGWDFDSIWAIDELGEINDGYPYLLGSNVFEWMGPPPSEDVPSGGARRVEPSATVSWPNGGETLNHGVQYQVFYGAEGTDVNGVRLSYSVNGGSTWTVMTSGAGGGYYTWTAPDVSTTTALLKVEAMGGGTVLASDTSDATFTIVGTPAPSAGGDSGPPAPPAGDEPGDEPGDQPGGGENNVGDGGAPGSESNPGTEGAGSSASGPESMPREEANSQLPTGYPVDALVKMANDNNPDTQEDSTVYYIGLDAKRHPFPSPQMYLSWYADYGTVIDIDATTLAGIPMGAPILVRPGTRWVKLATDPKTYYVAPGYRLRWIQDEAAAVALWGPDWNRNILDVSDALFVNFTVGAPITAEGLSVGWPSGSLVQGEDGVRWYMTTSERREVASQAAFEANLFQAAFVRLNPAQVGWQKPVGAPITGHEDSLTSLMH